jgi:hypothetical protein
MNGDVIYHLRTVNGGAIPKVRPVQKAATVGGKYPNFTPVRAVWRLHSRRLDDPSMDTHGGADRDHVFPLPQILPRIFSCFWIYRLVAQARFLPAHLCVAPPCPGTSRKRLCWGTLNEVCSGGTTATNESRIVARSRTKLLSRFELLHSIITLS